VLSSKALHEQLSIIMGALTKAAVAEICEVVDEGYAVLQLEITRSHKENEDLRKKLHLIESIVVRGSGGGKAAAEALDYVQVLDGLRGRLRDYVQVLDGLRGRHRDYVQVLDSLRGRHRDYVQVLDGLRGRLRDYVQVLDSLRGRHRDYIQVLDGLRGRHRD
ncbi:hypothetical protein GBF38_015889, partial [Nibea albiflora]